MTPARSADIATPFVLLALLLAVAALLVRTPQVRVLCTNEAGGNLSADMDAEDATQTPAGWVLHFPRRADQDRRVEVWETCEVHP